MLSCLIGCVTYSIHNQNKGGGYTVLLGNSLKCLLRIFFIAISCISALCLPMYFNISSNATTGNENMATTFHSRLFNGARPKIEANGDQ